MLETKSNTFIAEPNILPTMQTFQNEQFGTQDLEYYSHWLFGG